MLSKGVKDSQDKKPVCKIVTETLVRNVEAARSVEGILIPSDKSLKGKSWRSRGRWPVDEVIPMRDGLVHLPSVVEGRMGCRLSNTPRFFCLYSLPYDFRPDSGLPVRGLEWLDSSFPDDPESIDSFQEFCGAVLDATNLFMKDKRILMVIGPTRSGKGLMAIVLQQLAGPENVAALTSDTVAETFGLSECIGKILIVVGDAKVDASTKAGRVLMEKFKNITGGDLISINRKYLKRISVKLTAKGAFMANEIPTFRDPSGAIVNRFLYLQMTESFLGMEDRELGEAILDEMSRWFNWAIVGLRRLKARGGVYFQPESGMPIVREMEATASPVKQFIQERYDFDPKNLDAIITAKQLFRDWESWQNENGEDVVRVQEFGKMLRSAFPKLKAGDKRSRTDTEYGDTVSGKHDVYIGLTLKPECGVKPTPMQWTD
jgi:putative DNA primase/helicase